jgi:hypothetical protein
VADMHTGIRDPAPKCISIGSREHRASCRTPQGMSRYRLDAKAPLNKSGIRGVAAEDVSERSRAALLFDWGGRNPGVSEFQLGAVVQRDFNTFAQGADAFAGRAGR